MVIGQTTEEVFGSEKDVVTNDDGGKCIDFDGCSDIDMSNLLQKSLNLSDVASVAIARTNLDIYSKAEINTMLTGLHTHSNKSILDKFGEDADGKPTYNGNLVDTTIAQRDVYDGLDSNDNTISLSAKQGKVINDDLQSYKTTVQEALDLKADVGEGGGVSESDIFLSNVSYELSRKDAENYNTTLILNGTQETFGYEEILAKDGVTLNIPDTAVGIPKCLEISKSTDSFITSTFMPILQDSYYRISMRVKAKQVEGGDFGKALNRIYIILYNVLGGKIHYSEANFFPNSYTNLTKDLNDGDTKMYVTSHADWYRSSSAIFNRFVWWELAQNGTYAFTETNGYIYEPDGYTRNISGFPMWEDENSFGNDADGDFITLENPWSKGTLPAGTRVAQPKASGDFLYINISTVPADNQWHTINTTPKLASELFWKGAFYFQFGGAFGVATYRADGSYQGALTADIGRLYVAEYSIFRGKSSTDIPMLV